MFLQWMQSFSSGKQNICERAHEWVQKASLGNGKVLRVKTKLVGWTQNFC